MFSRRRLSWAGDLWVATGPGPGLIPADGCVDVIWRDHELLLSGPTTVPIRSSRDAGLSVGLRLRPGLGHILFGFAVEELRDACTPLNQSLGSFRVREGTRDPEEAFGTALAASIEAADSKALRWRAELIRLADSGASASAAAAGLGCSQRQFGRITRRTFGYGYRTFARIRRAERAVRALHAGLSPATVASHTGFADQPHLTRELRELIGRTPAQLVGREANTSTALPSGSLRLA